MYVKRIYISYQKWFIVKRHVQYSLVGVQKIKVFYKKVRAKYTKNYSSELNNRLFIYIDLSLLKALKALRSKRFFRRRTLTILYKPFIYNVLKKNSQSI